MRTFVIGSKKLSVDILETLVDAGHEVLGVISRDDEPAMKIWHEKLGHPSLKARANELGIPVYEGMKVNSAECVYLLGTLDLDVVFSCFWGEIFKKETLEIPKLGIFNLHTAYLPKNRGARPLPWAIIEGQPYAGITLHKMDTGVDNGPILSQEKVSIEASDTGISLYNKVCKAGGKLFRESLVHFERPKLNLRDQNESESTYHPRGEPFGGQINERWSEREKESFKRAFYFPPFRGHRNPPPAAMDQGKPKVYLVLQNEKLPELNMNSEIAALRRNDIGTTEERTRLRNTLLSSSTTDSYPGILLCNCGGSNGIYALHDLLHKLNKQFIVSDVQKSESWLKQSVMPQPYRHANGVLEIPALLFSSFTDLAEVVVAAQKQVDKFGRDIFVPIVFESYAAIEHTALSKQMQILNLIERTFAEVCAHYDTDYE